jgi:quercetin dioxygenase-like cupin family protein
MSTQLAMKNTDERNHHKQRLAPNGTVFEFLASPDETGSEICLIRGTIPPGVAVPLHSHSDVELFYVLEGFLETFQFGNGNNGWVSLGPGECVSISGNVKHALRNSSPLPVRMVVVTTSKLYSFFQEVSRPVDRDRAAKPPTPEAIEKVFETAARYGYWMGSPEENAAIGLIL